MAQELSQQDISKATRAEHSTEAIRGAAERSVPAWIVALAGIVAGLVIAMLWRADIADKTIGFSVANVLVPGSTAQGWTITDGWVGLLFAIAAGLGTTFTACNCAVFSCIVPLSNQKGSARLSAGRLLLLMAIAVIVVTAAYGIVGAALDKQVPSLSTATLPFGAPTHIPIRLLQSSGVFVVLGLILLYWGAITLQLVRNPMQRIVAQRAWMMPLVLGAIVGFFTVGRPYPLFHTLFQYSAGTGNGLFSALLIALQGLCNIAFMALLFLLVTHGTGGRFERWMRHNPHYARALTAFSFIGGGMFLIAYWGVRLFANFGIGWFPHI